MLKENSNAVHAPLSLSRNNSAAHETRMLAVEMEESEESDDLYTSDGVLNLGSSPDYSSFQFKSFQFKSSEGESRFSVMHGCLGGQPPRTFSLLFCPLIFLALNPHHDKYETGMKFWRQRFSQWDSWVKSIQATLPEDPGVLDSDSCTTELMFGMAGSWSIPHYTAAAQKAALETAGISHEVDVCALKTFHTPDADASLAASGRCGPAEQTSFASASPAASEGCGTAEHSSFAYVSLAASGGCEMAEQSSFAYVSLAASGGAAQPADNEPIYDNNEDMWWLTLM